ncbi:hypothetical protein KEU06_08695 [Pseudaminobacter sp. 19-2017]|uniref:Uncharacterized protein n=1 Tax=Pseudaminobacter soli (ex Zhang et al. 2022) TaxID=2831468 RepID=A0A942E155_9HYPH|nr:hypothetical protein [Pseudaminobacter soli]MBS3648705.1 hypothetical protein [Pseudaminobacter soli]
MSYVEPTPLEDALDLLEHETATWVVFKERVYLSYEATTSWAHGVWNFIFGVGIFWVEHQGPDCMIISEGSMYESDWSIYRSDDNLSRLFMKRFRECVRMKQAISKMDQGLC